MPVGEQVCGVASLDVDKMGWSGILDMDKDLELLKKDFNHCLKAPW